MLSYLHQQADEDKISDNDYIDWFKFIVPHISLLDQRILRIGPDISNEANIEIFVLQSGPNILRAFIIGLD